MTGFNTIKCDFLSFDSGLLFGPPYVCKKREEKNKMYNSWKEFLILTSILTQQHVSTLTTVKSSQV